MSIPNQVPESSMEEILASIRKIITEDEAKGDDAPAHSALPSDSLSPQPNNVSRLFTDRRGATRHGVDRTGSTLETGAEMRRSTPGTSAGMPADAVPTAASQVQPTAAAGSSARDSEPTVERQGGDRRLLSARAEAAVSESFAKLRRAASARNDPSAVEQLAERLMRPMVKAWLDQNLPSLVERIVREEIERVARRR